MSAIYQWATISGPGFTTRLPSGTPGAVAINVKPKEATDGR